MPRRTLLVIFSSRDESSKLRSELFRHFYKICLDEIPNEISLENFSSILYDPISRDFLMSLCPDTLAFIISKQDKIGYIGVSRDAFSRHWSIELPTKLTWEELIECAKQTPQSPISFV